MRAKKSRKMETNVTFDGDVAAIVVKPFSIEKHNRGLSRRSLFAVNAFSPQEEYVCLRQAFRIFFTDAQSHGHGGEISVQEEMAKKRRQFRDRSKPDSVDSCIRAVVASSCEVQSARSSCTIVYMIHGYTDYIRTRLMRMHACMHAHNGTSVIATNLLDEVNDNHNDYESRIFYIMHFNI
jgi:hypothetical protein